jgi:hypothetical protein
MTDPLEHILRLAFDVGPRPATSDEERRAAAYVEKTLQSLGFTVKTEEFRSPRSFATVMVPIFLLSLAGVAVAAALDRASLGYLLSGIAMVAFLGEATTALKLVSPLVPKRESQNVLGRLAPKELPRRRLVICAHYDSPKPDLMWRPRLVRLRRAAFVLLVLSMVILPAVLLADALTGLRLVSVASAPFALCVLAAVGLMFHRGIAYKHVPGANGNASGVAVMLTICEALAMDQPADTEVVALATGSQGAGNAGMQAYVKKHDDELERAWVLNLDSIGAGDVFYTTSEGTLLKHQTSAELRETAERVATLPGIGVAGRPFHLVANDTEPLLLRRMEAISVMAGNGGLPVNWHWKTDTVENIDPDSIDTAYQFLEAMVRRLIA